MNGRDPLAAWRGNPFFLLEVSPQASRAEVERAGQRLIGLLAVGRASAARYATPFGEATRDADAVRQALATLRDPNERAVAELWATVAPSRDGRWNEPTAQPWEAALRALGWRAP
jgi:curved DNA-binding protein CbpA